MSKLTNNGFIFPILLAILRTVLCARTLAELATECGPRLARLYEATDKNALIGCEIRTEQSLQQVLSAAMEASNCSTSILKDGHTVVVTRSGNATSRTLSATKSCLSGSNMSAFYVTAVKPSTSDSIWVYLERRHVQVTLPKKPVYREFPKIDLRLPSDFFYPFSCSSASRFIQALPLLYCTFLLHPFLIY